MRSYSFVVSAAGGTVRIGAQPQLEFFGTLHEAPERKMGRIWEDLAKTPCYAVACRAKTVSVILIDCVNLTQGGMKTATVLYFHEVEDGERWAKAWKKETPETGTKDCLPVLRRFEPFAIQPVVAGRVELDGLGA
jgi:hypothetical protein